MAQIEEVTDAKVKAASKEKEMAQSLLSKTLAFTKELVILVVTAFVLAFIFKTFIFQPFKVEMSSMMPNIQPNYRVLVNKFVYRFTPPKRGDIVTLYTPEATTKTGSFISNLLFSSRKILIKRVVATGGQTIEIRNGVVYVNDKAIKEKYVKFKDFSGFAPVTVPKNKVFVMGDNRANSKDSRVFGAIKKSDILGKALLVYWPPSAIRML